MCQPNTLIFYESVNRQLVLNTALALRSDEKEHIEAALSGLNKLIRELRELNAATNPAISNCLETINYRIVESYKHYAVGLFSVDDVDDWQDHLFKPFDRLEDTIAEHILEHPQSDCAILTRDLLDIPKVALLV